MYIALSIPIQYNNNEQINYVLKGKNIGVNDYWIGDNPPINNAFLNAQLILSAVPSVRVGTGITSPFYYNIQSLTALACNLWSAYNSRFILGLGIGKIDLLKELKTSPFTNFKNQLELLISSVNKRLERKTDYSFPSENYPLALGGLGNKFMDLALKTANILLLNSASYADIERAIKKKSVLVSYKQNSVRKKVFSYAMCEISDSNQNQQPSLILWNIIKDIARMSTRDVLKEHGYSLEEIKKIKKFSIKRDDTVPENPIVKKVIRDYALWGTVDQIIEKIDKMKEKNIQGKRIDGFVIGWINRKKNWSSIKEIIRKII